MQVAIDNAKRTFDIDLNKEISRIKQDMDITNNGFPSFWFILQRKNKFAKSLVDSAIDKERIKRKKAEKTNKDIQCPMNYLYNLKLNTFRSKEQTLPMSVFYKKSPSKPPRSKSRKVEDLIENYSLDLYNQFVNKDEDYFLLRNDFDKLIEEIKRIYISNNYYHLFSWLIDRAFCITPSAKRNRNYIDSTIDKNKSLLLKTLYDINPKCLLEVFSNNILSSK